MENQDDSQLELFTQPKDAGELKNRGGSFFTYIRVYEKTILVLIGFVITSVISFSLGVEKGKRISSQNNISNLDLAFKQVTTEGPRVSKQEAVVEKTQGVALLPQREPQVILKKDEPVKQQAQLVGKQGYIIQLASYKSRTNAQKEADILKKKGFSPQILSKGSYSVLYVGNFPNREKAQSQLTMLQKRYRGCYIRRL